MMKADKFRAYVSSTMLAAAFTLSAMPARPGLHVMQQPDGTQISVYLHGDEHKALYLTEDGYLLLPDSDGNLYFAEFDATRNIVPSCFKATPLKEADAETRSFLDQIDNKALVTAYMQSPQVKHGDEAAESPRKVRDQITDYPATGERKVLVILAEFSDKKFHTPDPAKAIGDMLNKEGYSDFGATGSARDYFIDNSAGQYNPQMVVYGPVQLPNPMAYYGGVGDGKNDIRPTEMIRDACQLIDGQVDFKEYDLDGDGYIDNVYLFYAGYSQADGAAPNTIWPHAAYAWNKLRAEFDGVKLDHYACSNEIDLTTGNIVGIGTFCHEFSHVLGLPDLYSTDYSTNVHPGIWSLMANGGYNNNGHTPPNMNAYERYALGWLDPVELSVDGVERELTPITDNNAFRISTDNTDEYFLIENRQQEGWDTYLPGHGMLVWHIDYDKKIWASNQVNNAAGHQRIDLMEADKIASNDTRTGDSFPGTSDVTEISGYSLPGFKTFAGMPCRIGLYNIRETEQATVLFNPCDPDTKLSAPMPEVTERTPVSFTISWNEVEGASSYVVDVYRKLRNGSIVSKQYVEGYRLNITDGNSLTIENLTPATGYNFAVRAMGGTSISDYCPEQEVVTLDKDFTFFAPETIPATDLTSTSFTAQWNSLDEATDYIVDVYEVNHTSPQIERNDIADGITAPQGWAASSNSTSRFPGYFGAESPGLTMISNDDFVRSPLKENAEVTRVSFWYRGTSVQDNNEIEISGIATSGEWKRISAINPVLREKPGYTIVIQGDGIGFPSHSVAISYRRPHNAGSIAIDDIEVEYSIPTISRVTDFTGKKTANALSLAVTGLKPNTLYRYEVTALSGNLHSQPSVPRNVRTLEGSGIDTSFADEAQIGIIVENGGINLINSSSNTAEIKIYGVCGTLLHKTSLTSGADTRWEAPAHGIYIIRSHNQTCKITL